MAFLLCEYQPADIAQSAWPFWTGTPFWTAYFTTLMAGYLSAEVFLLEMLAFMKRKYRLA